MNWTEHGVKRGSLQRGNRVDEDERMEDNSLYSGRETVLVRWMSGGITGVFNSINVAVERYTKIHCR
ncbi:docking protein 2-like protein [Lates japonicus]|uniref:Docking protein 2-like protein n=1 Tax=Lates japonicus TaxID=270547 RepID=A0AAD3RIS8_LATJO|nr:docking protein 2-like protein [Lates japonicus]GLD70157.1 docking protein 2-like protein [Lates japonicus]